MKSHHQNRTRQILRAAGYRLLSDCSISPQGNPLEFWTGPKGCVIVQCWSDGSMTTYADWPLGTTFEELEKALSGPYPIPDQTNAVGELKRFKDALSDIRYQLARWSDTKEEAYVDCARTLATDALT